MQGQGLITAAERQADANSAEQPQEAGSILLPPNPLDPLKQVQRIPADVDEPTTPKAQETVRAKRAKWPEIKLVCLDMDGTLLNSNSKVIQRFSRVLASCSFGLFTPLGLPCVVSTACNA